MVLGLYPSKVKVLRDVFDVPKKWPQTPLLESSNYYNGKPYYFCAQRQVLQSTYYTRFTAPFRRKTRCLTYQTAFKARDAAEKGLDGVRR